MQIIKYFMLFIILIGSSMIGKFLSKKYVYRLEELEEMQSALNIFKTKIKFTYEPIPEIFEEISQNTNKNISKIFKTAREKMKEEPASLAWKEATETTVSNLKKNDINAIKKLSKLLGQTDVEGQISQIEITEKLLENQISEAQGEKQKNEKMYIKLGTVFGLAIAIILA